MLASLERVFSRVTRRRNKASSKALAVVVSYSVYPGPLIESVASSGIPLRWHIHHHGPDASFAKKLRALSRSLPDAKLFDHRINRGLARSWNESLKTLDLKSNEIGFVFNDDIYFKPDGFEKFFHFVKSINAEASGFSKYYTVFADEVGAGALADVCPQGMACCAINAAMYNEIGPFDEEFSPAYYEDCDYFRRMRLVGHEFTLYSKSLCVHERRKSSLTNDLLSRQLNSIIEINKSYYIKKWGGEPDHEIFSTPFNS